MGLRHGVLIEAVGWCSGRLLQCNMQGRRIVPTWILPAAILRQDAPGPSPSSPELAERPRVGAASVLAQGRPPQQGVQRRAKGLAPVGEAVLDLGRHLRMDGAAHDAVPLHLAQLLDQHLLGDRRDRALEIRETQNLAPEETEKDHELPTPLKEAERLLDPRGSGAGRQVSVLTFG